MVAPALVQHAGASASIVALAGATTPGNQLVLKAADRNAALVTLNTAGWTLVATASHNNSFLRTGRLWVRTASGGDGSVSFSGSVKCSIEEWSGGAYGGLFAALSNNGSIDLPCGDLVAPPAGRDVVVTGMSCWGDVDLDMGGVVITPDAGVTVLQDINDGSFAPGLWSAFRSIVGAAGSYRVRGVTNTGGRWNSGITIVVVAPAGGSFPGEPGGGLW